MNVRPPNRAPLIGIEVDLETNPRGRRYTKCYETYCDAVSDAGGIPILLPPVREDQERVTLGLLGGVVVPGGDDFSAADWGEIQRPCPRFTASDDRRLAHGRQLMRLVLEAGLPYLGVCYGAQLLCLARGGKLIQDIPDELPQAGLHSGTEHALEVSPGSLLAELIGAERPTSPLLINSRHHQAVREPGQGLVVSGRAPDGVIEAIESEPGAGHPYLLGVQWHPEDCPYPRTGAALFDGLVERARACAGKRIVAGGGRDERSGV